MVSKAANTAEVTETREEAAETPLLDTLAAAIKKMLARGKERGYITYDELNAALPQDQVSSEQIEDTMTTLSELGINIIESEEIEDATEADPEEVDKQRANLAASRPAVYVFSNPAMPGLYKIGWARDVAARRKVLSLGTMVPDDFVVEAVYQSNEPKVLESHIHAYFANFRYNRSKEFFKVNPNALRRHIRRCLSWGYF